jgi:hypothetical protein
MRLEYLLSTPSGAPTANYDDNKSRMAVEVLKAMQADGLDWTEGYRPVCRQALEEIIENQTARSATAIFRHRPTSQAAARDQGWTA